MPTLDDVARVAGVSKNTVSRCLNDRGYISEVTRDKIQNAIELLHYRPNQVARSLATSKTNTIGLVIPDVSQPFFAEITSYLEDELAKEDYRMILCDTMISSDKEKQYLSLLSANKVDGIIVGSHSIDIDYSQITEPVIALDRDLSPAIPTISADHEQGGRLAAWEFIKRGCTCVAQVEGFSQVRTPSEKRHLVFRDEMRKQGIEVVTYELGLNQFAFDSYASTAQEILDDNHRYDGFFASDLVALAVQKEAQKRGMIIPRDLFIFGYDGTPLHKIPWPGLPTIKQPFKEIAQLTVKVLLDRINGIEPTKKNYILPVSVSVPE
ncbi:LacI family transcriptional regulator [Parascardovia denticolens IPLA 20019]|uniref:LacI family DNA-binding transcriptional regulator n=1 Tax=Parascardovia denticolens TaxID=78258 RepID=UPI000266982A|nr:LacI family DNA-binding transcriptional regulator [Parascardovia denticolens]EIT88608.1 LacI family transcriptional regulator [Parascardovia denticolens IPLA 20019]